MLIVRFNGLGSASWEDQCSSSGLHHELAYSAARARARFVAGVGWPSVARVADLGSPRADEALLLRR